MLGSCDDDVLCSVDVRPEAVQCLVLDREYANGGGKVDDCISLADKLRDQQLVEDGPLHEREARVIDDLPEILNPAGAQVIKYRGPRALRLSALR